MRSTRRQAALPSGRPRFARAAVPLLLLFVSLVPILGAKESVKGAFKDVGQGFKKLGRKIGEAGKDAGLEIADAAKKVFYKGKKVSAPLLRDVQHSTREFWGKVIGAKDKTIDKLRQENEEMKRQLDDEDEDND